MDDWKEWSNHILLSLERLDKSLDSLTSEMVGLQIKISKLETEIRVKSGIMGAICGFGVSVIAYFIER